MEPRAGIEPATCALRGRCSARLSYRGTSGAGNGSRTRDIELGKLALYQLSYSRKTGRGRGIRTPGLLLPKQALCQAERCPAKMVWVTGIEPAAFRSRTGCSTRLSYTQMVDREGFEPPKPEGARFTGGWFKPLTHRSVPRARRTPARPDRIKRAVGSRATSIARVHPG